MAKIIILSCKGGGGHMSAAQAIAQALGEHSVHTIDFLGEDLAHIDPFFWLTQGYSTGQDCYNFLLSRNYKRLINILYYIGQLLCWLRQESIKNAYQTMLNKHQPQLCISVIPLFNGIFCLSAKNNKIPLLLIPTDFDVRSFIRGLKRQHTSYTWLAGGFFDKKIRSFISPSMINHSRVCNIGFPVKKDFLVSYSKTVLLKKLDINPKKKIIFIIMGAMGSRVIIDYLKALCNISAVDIHVLICLGKSKYLEKGIKKIRFSSNISYSILPSTISVAQAMSIADLCISKPGSVTLAEAMYSDCVIFLDATSPLVIWEAFNVELLKRQGNGQIITNYGQITTLVERFFNDHQWAGRMIAQAKAIEKNDFKMHLSALILTIINTTKIRKPSLGVYE